MQSKIYIFCLKNKKFTNLQKKKKKNIYKYIYIYIEREREGLIGKVIQGDKFGNDGAEYC